MAKFFFSVALLVAMVTISVGQGKAEQKFRDVQCWREIQQIPQDACRQVVDWQLSGGLVLETTRSVAMALPAAPRHQPRVPLRQHPPYPYGEGLRPVPGKVTHQERCHWETAEQQWRQ